MSAAEIGPVTLAELLTPVSRETLIAAGMHPLKATLAADFDARAVDAAEIEHEAYCDGWACAACNAPDDIPPEHAIRADIVLPPAAYEAVVELAKNPPPPTPALVACMAPEEPVTLADAVAMTNLLRDALGDRCRLSAEAADDAAYEDFLRMKAEAHRRADLLAMAGIVAQAIFGWLP